MRSLPALNVMGAYLEGLVPVNDTHTNIILDSGKSEV